MCLPHVRKTVGKQSNAPRQKAGCVGGRTQGRTGPGRTEQSAVSLLLKTPGTLHLETVHGVSITPQGTHSKMGTRKQRAPHSCLRVRCGTHSRYAAGPAYSRCSVTHLSPGCGSVAQNLPAVPPVGPPCQPHWQEQPRPGVWGLPTRERARFWLRGRYPAERPHNSPRTGTESVHLTWKDAGD